MDKLTTIQIPVHVRGDVTLTPKIQRMISDYATLLLTTIPTTTTEDSKGWANRFRGMWKDTSMSAEEQVAFVRESRSETRKDPFEL